MANANPYMFNEKVPQYVFYKKKGFPVGNYMFKS